MLPFHLFFLCKFVIIFIDLNFHNAYNFMCFSKNNNMFTRPSLTLSLFRQKESRTIQNQFQFGRSIKNCRNQYWPLGNSKMKDKDIKTQIEEQWKQYLKSFSTNSKKRYKKQRSDNKQSCIALEYYGECEQKYRKKSQKKSKKREEKSRSRERVMGKQRSNFQQPRNEYNEQVNEIKKNKVEQQIKQYLNKARTMNKRHEKQLSRLNDFSNQKTKKVFLRQKEEKLKLKQHIISWIETVC